MTKNLANTIELTKEEALHLGYDHNDVISMTRTEDGFIIYKKEEGISVDNDYFPKDIFMTTC